MEMYEKKLQVSFDLSVVIHKLKCPIERRKKGKNNKIVKYEKATYFIRIIYKMNDMLKLISLH
jgi:hypothetical protein